MAISERVARHSDSLRSQESEASCSRERAASDRVVRHSELRSQELEASCSRDIATSERVVRHSESLLRSQESEASCSREIAVSVFSRARCSVARREALKTKVVRSKEHSKVKRIFSI